MNKDKEMKATEMNSDLLSDTLNLRFRAILQAKLPFAEELVKEVKNE